MINAVDFVSEEAYYDAIDSEMGDGYHNESQRVFAHSKNTIENRDESARIGMLTAEGKFVAYTCIEVYCPHTDALIRVERRVHSVHDTYDSASIACHDAGGEFIDCMGIAMARTFEPEVTSTPRSVVDVAEGEPWDIPF